MAFDYTQISGPKRRAKVLLRTRNLKMARNAHAYVRGSTVKFYEWLEDGGRKLPAGPWVWICGDCHLGNLGPLADADGHVDVQIRDLDQTVIGNPVHDLVRLALSLASAARGSDLPSVTTARMLEEMMNGYEAALAGRFGGQTEKNHRPKLIREILDRAVHRKWRQLAEERIENVKPSIPLGKRFWALTKKERRALKDLLKSDGARELITALKGRREHDKIEVLDAAYWMKGCTRSAACGMRCSSASPTASLNRTISASSTSRRASWSRRRARRMRRCRATTPSAWSRGRARFRRTWGSG